MKQQKWLVAGLGGTGLSVLDYCREAGIVAAAYDESISAERLETLKQHYPETEWWIGDENVLAQALMGKDTLVLSPGITRRCKAIQNFEQQGGRVTGDIGIFSDLLRTSSSKILAITGSNGKTTVTSLTAHLCEKSGLDTVVAGNIGTPVLKAWLERKGKMADVWVLELSSFQLETTPNLGATAAVCLNISEDHLDRYNDLLDYAHSKTAIFNGVQTQILNQDDVFCRAMKREGTSVKWFSLNQADADYNFDENTQQLCADQTALMSASDTTLQGKHNMSNILAALALTEATGLERKQIVPHIASFKGLPHRVEKVGEKNGITFIDDSKGTNVGATVAAISGLSGSIVLIAGGLGKGQDFRPLQAALKHKVRGVFLIGEAAQQIANDVADAQIPTVFCATLPEAVQQAYAFAQAGETILLSPACASFDMFKGYAHRAEVFINAFQALPNQEQ